ncbi:xanthine dehydrogenase accessory protein XdhC [Aquibium carbonis]|uniref:Xanthine dehydrogenase accessory protein XdhC n=1 Tax=Aquibium carbonis TaxID=2495581 RepID=A0A429YNQ5_9HYPH|nr:xanthine dehydrogenase accessory protein XdhC [Aquibium carbonis]RST83095.1 xanthine dehydrogenase accessory protein XdhC [Aquibium carbonis]
MPATASLLRAFLDAHSHVARVEVAEAKGSTPREAGAWMLVAPSAIFGTIGGGQLEFMAIDRAREMLRSQSSPRPGASEAHTLDIPLGPEIGQCCGGRVSLSVTSMDEARRRSTVAAAETEDARLPSVLLFGGGHVGRALSQALALLPVRATVVETRAEALEGFPEAVATRLTPVPEEQVREAPPGAAFVVLTHDHALDFLIVAEALRRGDTAYVGMIGSQTKKATFRSWFLKTAGGSEAEFARLVSPIGGAAVRDKRPAVIAALAAAEIMTALAKA